MQQQATESKRAIRHRAALLLAGCAVALAGLAAWQPGAMAGNPTGPDALVVQAAGWLAWGLSLYLVIGVAVTAVGFLRSEPAAISRVAPRVVRRCVEVVVGATSAAALCVTPSLAYADSTAPAPAASASPLDWPGLAPSATATPEPFAPQSHQPAVAPTGSTSAAGYLVVRPGDSLWSLTAQRLGPHADTAQIAAAWPRLYAANRAAIGPDADLIHPGQHLVDPAGEGTRR